VEKPVSKFAFQVHNLQRYSEVVRRALADNDFQLGFTYNPDFIQAHYDGTCGEACGTINSVGLCTLNQVDP
jgi:hypothetical protein